MRDWAHSRRLGTPADEAGYVVLRQPPASKLANLFRIDVRDHVLGLVTQQLGGRVTEHPPGGWLGPRTPSLREGNQPVAIALVQSRRHHFPETPARVGQSCRKLSMSGSCGCSFPIRYEVKARASLRPQGGARRVRSHTETDPLDLTVQQAVQNSLIGRAGKGLTVRRSAGFTPDGTNSNGSE